MEVYATAFLPDLVSLEIMGQGENQPARLRLTLPDGSSESGELIIERLLAQVQPLAGSLEDGGESLGRCLYEALFPGRLGTAFIAAQRAAGQRGLRLMLEIDAAVPSLHRLRWEQIFYPVAGGWAPLASAPGVFFSRWLRTAKGWSAPLAAGPLRALLVISSPYPAGQLFVDVEKEKAQIEDVFQRFGGQVEWDILSGQVTVQQIADRLVSAPGFDILHYVGHGDWNEAEQTGYLMLTDTYPDGTRGPKGVPAAELLQKFSAVPRMPQLIVLSACESGQQSSSDAFSGVGPALVQAGCPAVVCMQEKVEMAVARRFSEFFYAALLESGCVDWAVNRGRAALLENHFQQWAVPVLYMSLLDGVLFSPMQRFKPAQRTPYKFLAPYLRDDQDLFMGRQAKTDEVRRRVNEAALTVVMGDEGVGLTSLMEAGVRPRLEAEGWWVVTLNEYADLAAEFRVQLRVSGQPMRLKIPGDAPLAEVLRAAGAAGFARLALFLDQFERVLLQPEEERLKIARALAAGVEALGDRLRLVLVVHKDAAGELAGFQNALGLQAGAWVEVPPLAQPEAVEAMVDPLRVLNWPVLLETAVARDQIAPDLSNLYSDVAGVKGLIDPGQLQITCTWLFNKARMAPQPLINSALYLESGGSEGILVSYMKQELETHFAGEQELAQKLLAQMAALDQEHWVSPEQLGGAAGQTGLLDRLARAELLVRRLHDGGYVYAFASPRVREEVQRLNGQDSEQAYNVRDELERAWRLWLAESVAAGAGEKSADRALPTRGQLTKLAERSSELAPRAVKALMLLRAAVLRDTPPESWMQLLREKEAESGLIAALELPEKNQPPSSAVELAGRLTGLDDPARAPRATGAAKYGDLTWMAVSGSDRIDRGTAVLALTALPDEQGLQHLDHAVKDIPAGFARWMRRGEVFGRLLDAGAKSPPIAGGGYLSVWLWRASRRIIRARGWLVWAALGGGVGAGLLLGLERMIVGILAQFTPPAIMFALFSYWGLLLAGLSGLGMALAAPLQLSGNRPSRWLIVLFGAVGFGTANLLVAVLNGISLADAPLVIPLGYAAGLGYAAAFLVGSAHWLRRLLLAAGVGLLFAGIQAIFNWAPQIGAGISISLSSGFFETEFDYFAFAAWQNWIAGFAGWMGVLSVIEAFFSGLALAFGGLTGFHLAERWYALWQKFLERSAD